MPWLIAARSTGHVIGADRYLGAKLGFWPDETNGVDELDHLATSAAQISAAEDQSPEQVLDAWRRGSGELLERLAALDANQLARPCRYNSLESGTGTVLIGRAFELWTHTEDICRATGRSLVGLDPQRLGAMTQVAAELVAPGARVAAGRDVTGTVRLVLTGPGGGTWNRRLDGQPVGGESHDVVLVADATDLSRVVANRVSPAELAVEFVGDRSLGELVLAGLSSFALD